MTGMQFKKTALALTLGFFVCVSVPALADQGGKGKGGPDQEEMWKKKGHGRQHGDKQPPMQHQQQAIVRNAPQSGGMHHFDDHQRTIIRDYYADSFQSGRCPPGLAKKHNGCQPPGQAKKWQLGHRLPSTVVYYDLPPRIITELGTPPAGYKYVRVASDILMIAVGTGMVMDAIQDLNHL